MTGMATNSTLLCIHRDPAQLSLLKESGYELATANNGSEGLRLFMSRPVDAVVLEYPTGLVDGVAIADEMKRVRPEIPIVALVDHLELLDGTLRSADAIVAKSDGAHFLWATLHFVLNVQPAQRHEAKMRSQTSILFKRPGRSREAAIGDQDNSFRLPANDKDAPFSQEVWRGIWDGTIQFGPDARTNARTNDRFLSVANPRTLQ
jgi:CheY-like chemotaxis protein